MSCKNNAEVQGLDTKFYKLPLLMFNGSDNFGRLHDIMAYFHK
jgi:hypothetical protein